LQWIGGMAPIFQRVRLVLSAEVPEFHWGIDKLYAQYFKLGASRRRAFLKGIRNECVSVPHVPPPLPALGMGEVRDHLTPGLPSVQQSEVTAGIWTNIEGMSVKLQEARDKKKIPSGALVVFSADRAEGRTYKQSYQVNLAPCLTCTNQYLLVTSIDDVHLNPEDREFCRLLLPAERFTMQGFKKEKTLTVPQAKRTKASGNAYPVPLILAELVPILNSIAMTSGLKKPQQKLEFVMEFEDGMKDIQKKLVDAKGHSFFHQACMTTAMKRPASACAKTRSASGGASHVKALACM